MDVLADQIVWIAAGKPKTTRGDREKQGRSDAMKHWHRYVKFVQVLARQVGRSHSSRYSCFLPTRNCSRWGERKMTLDESAQTLTVIRSTVPLSMKASCPPIITARCAMACAGERRCDDADSSSFFHYSPPAATDRGFSLCPAAPRTLIERPKGRAAVDALRMMLTICRVSSIGTDPVEYPSSGPTRGRRRARWRSC